MPSIVMCLVIVFMLCYGILSASERHCSRLPSYKDPGEDGIFNQYIKHFDRSLWSKILELSNLIWTTGEIPSSFTRSIICPIYKQGNKPSKECSSYHPIALASCLCKLIELLDPICEVLYFGRGLRESS
jgi:hypothetical protein